MGPAPELDGLEAVPPPGAIGLALPEEEAGFVSTGTRPPQDVTRKPSRDATPRQRLLLIVRQTFDGEGKQLPIHPGFSKIRKGLGLASATADVALGTHWHKFNAHASGSTAK
jgi:hypothetical protein